MKRLIPAVLMALALCACGKQAETSGEEPLRVETETTHLEENFTLMPYVGVVEEEQSTMVSFTGMALLKEMRVSEGQTVKKGQLLARIDDTQARNALNAANAALDQAVDARDRLKKLHETNSLPEMKWVEVESKVQQAEASFAICKKNLEDCTIYAPVSGVVGNKIMHAGETVLPTEPVLNILSIDRVKVRASVPEKEIAHITPQSVSAITLDALPNETFCGSSVEKGVKADALSHTYDIRIPVDNPDHRLLPGMVAKVAVQGQGDMHITLPVRAVQESADHKLFVWTVKDGKATRTPVTVGPTVGNRIIIESGLQEGQTVITDGYQKVGDGTPVVF